MADAGWEQRKQLLADALEMPEAERHSFLLAAAAGDADLHSDLVSLLRFAIEPDERFDAADSWGLDDLHGMPSEGSTGSTDQLERGQLRAYHENSHWLRPGSIIGNYKIIRLLGSGGMGDVFEAEQDRPRRLVALKVLRAGPTDPTSLRRFEFEAELLGRLQHPGIAQVYEAGVFQFDAGPSHPFLAMELVQGVPLVEFADSKKLDTPDRLQLLIRVCEAVEHAHQRGIIHRDLKPANILVAASRTPTDQSAGQSVHQPSSATNCQPKLIDFGIARIVDAANTENPHTQFTRAGDVLGTVQYMSPEQLAGDVLAITTRTDVYALGILAYRLLSGNYPFGRISNLMTAAEAIRTRKPTTPSAHNAELRGDLDTILLKAIEKAPSHRYASASDLAAEFSRVLHDEPIHARSASAAYRVRKFVKRNKGAVAAGIAVVLALVMGTAVSLWQAAKATRASTLARESESRAKRNEADLFNVFVSRNNIDSMLFAMSGTLEERQQTLTPLLPILERLGSEFSDDPQKALDIALLNFKIGHQLGSPYGPNLGDFAAAELRFVRALRLIDSVLAKFPRHIGAMTLRDNTVKIFAMMIALQPGRSREAYDLQAGQVAMALQLSQLESNDLTAWYIAALGAGELCRIASLDGPPVVDRVVREWECCFTRPPPPGASNHEFASKVALAQFQQALTMVRQNDASRAGPLLEAARASLTQALAFAPKGSESERDLELTVADVDRYGAQLARQQNDFHTSAQRTIASVDKYESVLAKYPGFATARHMVMIGRFEAAETLLKAGNPESALDQAMLGAAEALDMQRQDPDDVRMRGIVQSLLLTVAEAEIAVAEQLAARDVADANQSAAAQVRNHASNAIAYCELAAQLPSEIGTYPGRSGKTDEAQASLHAIQASALQLLAGKK